MVNQRFDSFPAAFVAFAIVFVVTFAAAGIGAAASVNAGRFYMELNRPAWAPSAAVFGPVWTILYTLIALAAFLVVREAGWRLALVPLAIFVLQLALNGVWTWLFFKWHLGGAAFLDIVILLLLVAVTAWVFWGIRPLAGVLMLPYLGWVGFATVLTWSVWRLNPGVL
ncbi:TspO/MBR family protein [Candidatus Zixiibacteriota bacterium]